MAERRELTALFERDLQRIVLPPEAEWIPTKPARLPMPVWLVATATVAAIVVALVVGSYFNSRQPTGVLATPTPTSSSSSGSSFLTVSGRVTDSASGQPISEIRVYFVHTFTSGLFDPAAKALTDASGRYQVAVLPGTYRVEFFAARGGQIGVCPVVCGPDPIVPVPYEPLWWPNGASESEGAEVAIDQDRADLNASLRQGHEIIGSFTFGGKGVRAFIVVQRAGPPRDFVAIGTTNADGTFRITVPDGSYYIEFAPLDRGPTGGAWPADIVVNGADVGGIDRVEP